VVVAEATRRRSAMSLGAINLVTVPVSDPDAAR
jgi:hypothetical protein